MALDVPLAVYHTRPREITSPRRVGSPALAELAFVTGVLTQRRRSSSSYLEAWPFPPRRAPSLGGLPAHFIRAGYRRVVNVCRKAFHSKARHGWKGIIGSQLRCVDLPCLRENLLLQDPVSRRRRPARFWRLVASSKYGFEVLSMKRTRLLHHYSSNRALSTSAGPIGHSTAGLPQRHFRLSRP